MDLFENAAAEKKKNSAPLAARMRPATLDEFVGQEEIVGQGRLLRRAIEADQLSSIIFWGPPGCGKTTLAEIIAHTTGDNFRTLSAVSSGIGDIREMVNFAKDELKFYGRRTVLFIDEIHRFNKAQQDAFLPFVEKGSIVLIGATTENPSFEVNAALLSRCKVFVLQALSEDELVELMKRAIKDPRGFGNQTVEITDEMLKMLAAFANGDARTALGTLEMVVLNGHREGDKTTVTMETLEQCISRKSLLYDKTGEEHYNIISALHKSMRNSDPDAAVYWLSRMLEAGEDPLYVARRLIRFASEDVGMADSRALEIAVAAYQASHFIGMPECSVNLTHAVVYLSMAPKSNALYVAYESAKKDAQKMLSEPVPLVIRNAPTKLMKELHYGEGYEYAHDTAEKLTAMQCLPDSLAGKKYYRPTEQGSEARVKERLRRIEAWKADRRKK